MKKKVKEFFEKLRDKEKHPVLFWIKQELSDWRTLVVFFIVAFILYTPTWGGYLYFFIFKSKLALTIATVYAAFWLGPFTPFWGIVVAITLGIKKLIENDKSGKSDKNNKNANKKTNKDVNVSEK